MQIARRPKSPALQARRRKHSASRLRVWRSWREMSTPSPARWQRSHEFERNYAKHQRKRGHWLVAAIADRCGEYLTLAGRSNSLDDVPAILCCLELYSELVDWRPRLPRFEVMPSYDRTAHLVVGVLKLNLDAQWRELALAHVRKPGRPDDVRSKAAYALELREEGKDWSEIEQCLLPHRKRLATGAGDTTYLATSQDHPFTAPHPGKAFLAAEQFPCHRPEQILSKISSFLRF